LGTSVIVAGKLFPARLASDPSRRINWQYVPWFFLVHLIAALALMPWFFSWTGVALFLTSLYVFGVFGVDIGYHRLLTHRSFACPLWLERAVAVCGVCCVQDSPALWVAIHRRHHHFADDERDPHSPIVSFFWAHIGWLLIKSDDMKPSQLIERYAKDVLRDPFQAMLERRDNWLKIVLLSWAAYFVVGFAVAAATGASSKDALQFGASLLVWGAALRTVYLWHTTWAVNSVAHFWGYRNYETPDRSRNNAIVAVLGGGGGWHNNHHADPNSARHGHARWEFDLSWLTILLLERVGLATEIVLPSARPMGRTRSIRGNSTLPGTGCSQNQVPPCK
jgi:fatty-acid desaturase